MYLDGSGVVQFCEANYNHLRQHSDGWVSGLTSSPSVAQEIPSITWNLDMDGISRIYNTVNIGAIKR